MSTMLLDLFGTETRYRGTKYRTRTIEAGSGEPLILIHGVGGHAEAYAKNVKRLGEHYHAIAMDLLWHGLSEKVPFTTAMVPAYGAQVLDLLDSIGAERAAIEGESLGGWIALWLALNHPERVSKIILNTNYGVRWDGASVTIDPATGSNLLRERSLAAIRDPNRETVRKRLEWLMATPDRVTEELIDLRHAIYNDPATNAALTNVFTNSFDINASADAIHESRLKDIAVPTLVLWSDKNPGAGPNVGKRTAELIPNAEYYCINDAAHWPQWEQPEDHDNAVLAFLAGNRAALAASGR
jgi:pimeloyl-ACP methyl ester carboxylesterase